jgi:hypothetical protein
MENKRLTYATARTDIEFPAYEVLRKALRTVLGTAQAALRGDLKDHAAILTIRVLAADALKEGKADDKG